MEGGNSDESDTRPPFRIPPPREGNVTSTYMAGEEGRGSGKVTVR